MGIIWEIMKKKNKVAPQVKNLKTKCKTHDISSMIGIIVEWGKNWPENPV